MNEELKKKWAISKTKERKILFDVITNVGMENLDVDVLVPRANHGGVDWFGPFCKFLHFANAEFLNCIGQSEPQKVVDWYIHRHEGCTGERFEMY